KAIRVFLIRAQAIIRQHAKLAHRIHRTVEHPVARHMRKIVEVHRPVCPYERAAGYPETEKAAGPDIDLVIHFARDEIKGMIVLTPSLPVAHAERRGTVVHLALRTLGYPV